MFKFFKKKPTRPPMPGSEPKESKRKLHPNLQKRIDEGWMAPAVTEDGREVIINDIQYFEYIRNGEAITYSRNLAYEKAVTEYHQTAGHGQMFQFFIEAVADLSHSIYNFRDTDKQRSELAMQELIGLADVTKAALDTKNPISHIVNVAAIYLVAENEDPDINNAAVQLEKYEAFMSAYEYHDFFFRIRIVPLNIWQVLSEANLAISTAQAYNQVVGVVKPIYLSLGDNLTDNSLKGLLRRWMALSTHTIESYAHLFEKHLSNLNTSGRTTNGS